MATTQRAGRLSLTAVYDGRDMIVHRAHCEHRVEDMTYPEVHEKLHLSGTSRLAVTGRIWGDSLATDKHPEAFWTYCRRTHFQSCTAALGA